MVLLLLSPEYEQLSMKRRSLLADAWMNRPQALPRGLRVGAACPAQREPRVRRRGNLDPQLCRRDGEPAEGREHGEERVSQRNPQVGVGSAYDAGTASIRTVSSSRRSIRLMRGWKL